MHRIKINQLKYPEAFARKLPSIIGETDKGSVLNLKDSIHELTCATDTPCCQNYFITAFNCFSRKNCYLLLNIGATTIYY
jgi:hypothetical protein